MDITKLYQTQISLTEWLQKIGHTQAEAIRAEDNDKRERLRVLNEHMGLPFDRPVQFAASEVADRSTRFVEYLTAHGHELCALRLIPLDPALPKLRMRGHTVTDALDWFAKQEIDPTKYKADFVPHAEQSTWSTIFVVSEHGVFGEIIRGGHHQLTQGFYQETKPISFSFDWQRWQLSETDDEALTHLQNIVGRLRVSDSTLQQVLAQQLQAQFVREYLLGYFETAASDAFGLWFIDWSRLLGSLLSIIQPVHGPVEQNTRELHGQTGSRGVSRGRVKRIVLDALADATICSDEILVCEMTTPDYVPLMQSAAGVVTDLGGILSHAAIVCRELRKPCVVGTQNATNRLQNGMEIELDADHGVVRILE